MRRGVASMGSWRQRHEPVSRCSCERRTARVSVLESGAGRRNRPAPLEVEVLRVDQRGGNFVRVSLGGDSLSTFSWPGPASHLKIFPPVEEDLRSRAMQEGMARTRFLSRTYTPRAFDPERRVLAIDFLLHGDGPAASWAAQVRPGDRAQVSTPRALYRVDPDAAWLLLAGDDSAIPAIGSIVDAGLGVPTSVFVETTSRDADRPELPEHPLVTLKWIESDPERPSAELQDAIRNWSAPDGLGALWVACEAQAVRAIRRDLVDERGFQRENVVTRGYWRKGEANHPDHDFGEDSLETP
jgi:NADPH-dependent ferric siderophore reductase